MSSNDKKTQVVIIGGGPAGYSAAFRCADLGLDVILIEKYENLGGVCLNAGCIPSKALLHIAKIIEETKLLKNQEIISDHLLINTDKINIWKDKIIKKLTNGLLGLAKHRKVEIIHGLAKFIELNKLEVITQDQKTINIAFENAIIATGSNAIKLPFIPYEDSRIWNSTKALQLKKIPNKLLIIGGGIIGLEISTIYHALGSKIDIVEMFDQIMINADKDIAKIFSKFVENKFNIMTKTILSKVESKEDGLYVSVQKSGSEIEELKYDAILVAVGRVPNSKNLGLRNCGIKTNDKGFIVVNNQMCTNIPHIYAVGDVVGSPMLAHKAIHEAHIAAEVISGKKHFFDTTIIPYIAYTDPEVAWVGVTEKEAKENNIDYEVSIFPWKALGRAIISNSELGITKLIFNKQNNKIIGGSVIGSSAGELLGEISLAIEMGCDAQDIALTIHAHPTLYESIRLSAEVFEGSVTDITNLKNQANN